MTLSHVPPPDPLSEIDLRKGDLLYREKDAPDFGYLIESGEIALYRTTPAGRVYVERRGAGSILGEFSVLTNQPRAVSAEAATDCRVYQISAKKFHDQYSRIDPITRAAIQTSIEFLTRMNSNVADTINDAPLIKPTFRDPTKLVQRFQLERDILRGLDADQFSLAYQPIVRLQDAQIVGFEALMRWQHPDHGNIPPNIFIDVAESMGSIARLTDFALMESCAALKRFRDMAPDVPDLFASVNISGEDIGRSDFVDFLAHVLDLNDLDSRHLKLEVTETALVPDSKAAEKTLKQLEACGCGISIDDFGIGYSNLAYLKELPLTALKIDRAFAGDACKNSVSKSIVSMLIGLGRELGVDVVAEGLENQNDVDTLLALGCDLAQGYHFSKPVPEADFAALISSIDATDRKIA